MMGKQTTAEYVESAEALEILRQIGVDYVQGNHLGRPAPLDKIGLSAGNHDKHILSLSK